MPIETGYIDEVIESLQWDYRDQWRMRLFPHPVNPNVFLIAHSVSGVGVSVTTIQANDDGSLAYIDTLQIEADPQSVAGSIVHVDGDVYCTVYSQDGGTYNACIRTFSCDVNGNLGALIDFHNFWAYGNVTTLTRPDIIHVPGGTKYAVVATAGGNDGWLITIDIANDGTIGAVADDWEFDGFNGTMPRIFLRAGNIFVIYYSTNNVFCMRSVPIAADGTIGAQVDNQGGNFYQGGGEVVHLDGDLYIAVYSTAVAGWTECAIGIFEIDVAGNITPRQRREITFESMNTPCVINTGDNIGGTRKVLCIGTNSDYSDGGTAIVTLEVSDNGNIFPDFIDEEIAPSTRDTRYYQIAVIHDHLYLVVYANGIAAPAPGWAETRLINALVVSTQAPEVEAYRATLKGILVYDEMQACDVRFEYGRYPNFEYYTDWQSGFRMGEWFEETVALAPGVTYQFRAQGRSVSGITSGATRVFTTVSLADSSPVAITEAATGVLARQAVLNGLVGFDGFEECRGWLEYGLSKDYGFETPVHDRLRTGDAFTENVTDLTPGQSYHVRAVLVDARGRKAFGVDKTFSTLSERGEMSGFDFALVGLLDD